MQNEIPESLVFLVKSWNNPHYRSKRAWISFGARPLALYNKISAQKELAYRQHGYESPKGTPHPKTSAVTHPKSKRNAAKRFQPIARRTRSHQKTRGKKKK